MKTKKTHTLRAALVAGVTFALPLASTMTSAPPAHAITVFDPSNYAQNVIQAARALQQINNQITSLQNEAQMILNQARNLASLPYSSLQQLQQSVNRTQQLLGQAQRIAYDVQNIEEQFRQNYGRGGFGSRSVALWSGAPQPPGLALVRSQARLAAARPSPAARSAPTRPDRPARADSAAWRPGRKAWRRPAR